MRYLLWKDFRGNLTTSIGCFVLLLAPYAIFPCAELFSQEHPLDHWIAAFGIAGMVDLYLSAIIAAVYGAAAFAAERRERFADFLAMLPITRGRILRSKLLLVLAILAGIWAFNGEVVYATRSMGRDDLWVPVVVAAMIAVCMFGIAWMLSAMINSAALAASIAIGFAVMVVLSIQAYVSANPDLRSDHERLALVLLFGIESVLGLIGFVIGSVVYVRRVSP